VLHGLELGDGALEGDALIGVGHGGVENGFQRTSHLHGSHRRAHEQQFVVQSLRRILDSYRPDAVQDHGIQSVAGETGAVRDPGRAHVRQNDCPITALALGQQHQMLSGPAEWNGPQPPADGAVCRQADGVAGAGRAGHCAARRGDAHACQQPSGKQGLRNRQCDRQAASFAHDGEAVGEVRSGPAQLLRNPGQRQPGFLQRRPRRSFPALVRRPVDGLRIAEIAKNPPRGLGDQAVACHVTSPEPSFIPAS
jgi:hypothetical protein